MDSSLDTSSYEVAEDPREDEGQTKIGTDRLFQLADAKGDISHLLTEHELTKIGAAVVEEWEMDRKSLAEWREDAERALSAAAQDKGDAKNYPWDLASDVKYPTLTVAAQQFAARAYPAIVRDDTAVGIKVLGDKPQVPDQPAQQPMPGQPSAMPQQNPALAAWQAKEARAQRVAKWLNYRLFYGMDDWEADVDVMLNQIPIVGMGFKKIYRSPQYGVCSEYVSALHLTVHANTKSLQSCPRITHDFELYPYEIVAKINQQVYRDVADKLKPEGEDDQAPRCILEQYRMHDLDDDGVPEPYIVTVDKETQEILRIEAQYDRADALQQNGRIVGFKRFVPFIAFPFMPDPKGRFYGIGFGKLLDQITASINTSINQLIDAGHAQVAGGGFIASGVRIQSGGQGSTVRWKPGEYKTVNAAGGDLRGAVWDRPVPAPSPVLFQLLDLLLAAAKDVSSVKDVLTGDAPTNGPVGTTMALIEQGLQSFTAIYKRIYRSLKAEFRALYECEARWGGQEAAEAYAEFFDGDPQANFQQDFDLKGYDISPVSDPKQVTMMQRQMKAQFAMQFIQLPFANGPQIMKRALQAADIDDPDELIMPPQAPNPMQLAELDKTQADAAQKKTAAIKNMAEAGAITGEHEATGAFHAGLIHQLSQPGGLPAMAGQPGDAMGVPGAGNGVPGQLPGMDQQVMGGGASGPALIDGA